MRRSELRTTVAARCDVGGDGRSVGPTLECARAATGAANICARRFGFRPSAAAAGLTQSGELSVVTKTIVASLSD